MLKFQFEVGVLFFLNRMYDFEHKTNPLTGENKLYILMERGDCDLESIIRRLIKQKDLTPAKLRFYWEEMLEVRKAFVITVEDK